jgi:hypothetical protein
VKPTITLRVCFRQHAGRGEAKPRGLGDRLPRLSRLLASAHQIDRKIRSGELHDLAHAARTIGVTRARMTQVMNLLLLAPEIQEAILLLPPVRNGRDPITERQLRPIVAEPNWDNQLAMWRNNDGLAALLQDRDGSGVLRQASTGVNQGD